MKKYIPIILLLSFHLFLLAQLRFTAWPEMLSYAYLKNHGFLLYKDMIHPYPPVLTLVLSYVYKAFGYDLIVLKTFSWAIILFSDLCVWLLAREITKKDTAAILSLAVYVFLQPVLEGNMLWFDIAIVPPLLLGAYMLLRGNLLLGGIFLSMAGFIKQTGGLFYLSVLCYLILTKAPGKQLKNYLIGPFIFGIPLLIRLMQESAVIGFWNWVVYYPAKFWSKFPGYVQMSVTPREILIIGLLIAPIVWLSIRSIGKRDKNLIVLMLFTVLSLISVYPRFSFFHLQTTIALSAVLLGTVIAQNKKLLMFPVISLPLILVLMWPQIKLEWGKEARFYGSEEIDFANKLSDISKSDTVFLQGIQSGIYVFSNTLPPKPWGDNFGWYYEVPGIQEATLIRWEQNPPETIVWRTPNQGNQFDLGTYEPKKIVDWIQQNYFRETELRPGILVWRKKPKVVSGVEP